MSLMVINNVRIIYQHLEPCQKSLMETIDFWQGSKYASVYPSVPSFQGVEKRVH